MALGEGKFKWEGNVLNLKEKVKKMRMRNILEKNASAGHQRKEPS